MMKHIGSAELRFFGWRIYTATLLAADTFEGVHYTQSPVELRITYHRALEGKLIAERSLLEMRRLGAISTSTAHTWLALMIQAFPNVAIGDCLSGQTDGKGLMVFRHNDIITTQIHDVDFADRFFGIWLHEQTSEPLMRMQLFGLSKAAS
ncbi:MAG: hypothetical protein QM533_09210 [Cytophagales bacterium]|nr:hypothetical protein [Cytophagales bacterium]